MVLVGGRRLTNRCSRRRPRYRFVRVHCLTARPPLLSFAVSRQRHQARSTMTAKRPKRKERPGVDRAGRTPLHYAAVDGDVALVKQLLASGMNPSAPDDDGWTPLH